MICPICNREMESGEIRTSKIPRVGESIYWMPQTFINEYINPLAHSKNTIIDNEAYIFP